MTVTSIASPSRRIAAEIRAEAARQGVSIREVARRLEVSQMWLSRRVKVDGDVDMTFEELVRIAAALDVPLDRLLSAAGWPVTYGYPSLGIAA
jgi:transcriptional regulator with XRE-family HTH domain